MIRLHTKQPYRDKSSLLTKTIEHSIYHTLTNRHHSNMLDIPTRLFYPLNTSAFKWILLQTTNHISYKKYFSETLILTSKFLLVNLLLNYWTLRNLKHQSLANHTIHIMLKTDLSCITTKF